MKKLVALLAIAMMASSAFAIVDDGVNSLGVYFDEAFEANCIDPMLNVPHQMYFVLANCSQATIGGFEFAWNFDPAPAVAPFILATILPPGGLNIGDANNLIVGLGTPLATGEATVLVQFTAMWIALPGEMTYVTAGPPNPATIPGHCAFNDGADVSLLFPMAFSTVDGTDVVVDPEGWVRPGLGTIGCPGPVATEAQTFSTLKALFR